MEEQQTITGLVLNSGAPGTFDDNGGDFDILREAVITAGLDGVLNSPDVNLTVFAPQDAAFVGLAQALGYTGSDEQGSLGFIVEALTLLGGGNPIPLLTDILSYHVLGSEVTSADVVGLGNGAEIETLLGSSLTLNLESDPPSLGDADPGIDDPGLIVFDQDASNGIVHVLDGVLLPVSVTGILSQPDTDFILGNKSDEFFFTGDGNDFIQGAGGRDLIIAGSGNDVALGGTGNDRLFGWSGNDTLRGDEGHDRIFGGNGADIVDGGTGNDRLLGGKGNDTLDGGAGNDTMFGGRGSDTFVYENGHGDDWVIGFRSGQDKIDLSGYEGVTGFDDIEHNISTRFFRTEIEFDDGGSLNLTGFGARHLTEDDFLFA